ncbi:hypothetical protein [Pseudomonas savastanoi]|uniref:hypothetical protein n=1 Tax=Pseudomonas savastanoi TaxID=29438 RepID=UPI001F24E5A8|nr:hypothetical protein [Pseudomonas savastanoi]
MVKGKYPAELLDHKRDGFEASIKRIAVERYGYPDEKHMVEQAVLRLPKGDYAASWVRGAWDGFNIAHENGGHGLDKHKSIPVERGLYWYFEKGKAEPRPVMVDPTRWVNKFKSFNGSEQAWLADGEYLLGPQPVPADQPE